MGFYLTESTFGTAAAEDWPAGPPARVSRRIRPGSLASRKPHRGPICSRILSSKYRDWELKLHYYGYRYHDTRLARWISRDPMGEMGVAGPSYVFVQNSPLDKIDSFGLWGTTVHKSLTAQWARDVSYKVTAANAVGDADENVDNPPTYLGTGPLGDQTYHFDRSHGGVDSRLAHNLNHFGKATKACSWTTFGEDDPTIAVKELGLALHPLQDWVAHADYSKNVVGYIATIHNTGGPVSAAARGIPVTEYPDTWFLDVSGATDGRAAGSFITFSSALPHGIAAYVTGYKRLFLTENKTKKDLADFLTFVKRHAKTCGKCRSFFIGP